MSESNQIQTTTTTNSIISTSPSNSTNIPLHSPPSAFAYPKSSKKYEFIDDDESKTVRVAKCLDNDEHVAIKRISFKKADETLEDLMKETQITKSMRHDNVVKYCTSFPVANDIWLVTKFLDGGSLLDTINFRMRALNAKHGVLDEIMIATILREVLTGLEYIHSEEYIHRDIKAANILIGLDGSIQIADYGVSAAIEDTKCSQENSLVGTPCWMAPEIMNKGGYDAKVDIWSLGITTIEMAVGMPPYFSRSTLEVLQLIQKHEPPTLETCETEEGQYKNYSSLFRNFIACCLKKKAEERMTATELLRHEFLTLAKDKIFTSKYLALPADLRSYEISEPLNVPAITHCKWVKTLDRWGVWLPDSKKSDKEIAEVNGERTKTRNIEKKKIRTKSVSIQPLHFILKIRDENKELINIKFGFTPGKDTPDMISRELVAEKYIDGTDLVSIACYLTKLLDDVTLSPITFQVKSGLSPNEETDINTFVGYAQLHYVNNSNNNNGTHSNN